MKAVRPTRPATLQTPVNPLPSPEYQAHQSAKPRALDHDPPWMVRQLEEELGAVVAGTQQSLDCLPRDMQ